MTTQSHEPVTYLMSKAAFAAVASCASKDDGRVNLNVVAFYADGRLAATDGHRLAIYLAGAGLAKANPVALLPRQAARDALKAMRKSDQLSVVITDRDRHEPTIRLTVRDRKGDLRFQAEHRSVDVTFPPVWNIVPVGPAKPSSIAINGAYLAESSKTLGAVSAEESDSPCSTIEFYTYGDLEPMVIRTGDYLHLVMPVRPDKNFRGGTADLRPKSETKAA